MFFLMKLATRIDSRMENMRKVLICLPKINFGYYDNLTLLLAYNGKMRILENYMDFVPMT